MHRNAHPEQLNFAQYWEMIPRHRGVGFEVPTDAPADSPFDFKLRRRRPLWKDMATFGCVALAFWGMSHVTLNFSAYTAIASHRVSELQASLIESMEPEPIVIEKLSHRREPFRNKTIKPQHHAQEVFEKWSVHPSDNRIVLPRIGKNVPLVTVPTHRNWQQLEKNIQSGLQDGVVVHPVSHAPGNNGNFFLTGHSSYYPWDAGRYKDVFALLHEVEEGDIAEVYWEGKKYIYELSQQRVVPPTETSILNQPTDEKMVTLMTCTPVGTNKNRLIWTGELLSVE